MSDKKTGNVNKQLELVKSLKKAKKNPNKDKQLIYDTSDSDYTEKEEMLNYLAEKCEIIDLMTSHYEIVSKKIEEIEMDAYSKEITLERLDESLLWLRRGIELL